MEERVQYRYCEMKEHPPVGPYEVALGDYLYYESSNIYMYSTR